MEDEDKLKRPTGDKTKDRSAVERDLEAADRIIDRKSRSSMRRASVQSYALKKDRDDTSRLNEAGIKRRGSLTVEMDLEAADRIIDRKNRASVKPIGKPLGKRVSSMPDLCSYTIKEMEASKSSEKSRLSRQRSMHVGGSKEEEISRQLSESNRQGQTRSTDENNKNKNTDLAQFVPPHLRRRRSHNSTSLSVGTNPQGGPTLNKPLSVPSTITVSSTIDDTSVGQSIMTSEPRYSMLQGNSTDACDFTAPLGLSKSRGQDRSRNRRQTISRCENVDAEDSGNATSYRRQTIGSQRRPSKEDILFEKIVEDEENKETPRRRASSPDVQSGRATKEQSVDNKDGMPSPRHQESSQDKAAAADEKRGITDGKEDTSKRKFKSMDERDNLRRSSRLDDQPAVEERHSFSRQSRRRRSAGDTTTISDDMSFRTNRTDPSRRNNRNAKSQIARRQSLYNDRDPYAPERGLSRTYSVGAFNSANRSIADSSAFTKYSKVPDFVQHDEGVVKCFSMPIADDDPTQCDHRTRRPSNHTLASGYSSANTSLQSRSMYDNEDGHEERTEYVEDDITEPLRDSYFSKLYHRQKPLERKQRCCLLITFAVSLAAILLAILLVVLPAVNKQRNMAAEATEGAGENEDVGHKVNLVFRTSNSSSPSMQPSLNSTLESAALLDSPPTDIEGRCSPSNFPDGSSMCKETCTAAECCYPDINSSEDKDCFDISPETQSGSSNLRQCERYRPFCDVFYEPWVQSFNGIIRPPPDELDRVCRNRRRRHIDTRKLGELRSSNNVRKLQTDDDSACLVACLPSKCCFGIDVADFPSEGITLSDDGAYIDANGTYVIVSCLEKNQNECKAYEKLCQGVFERNDATDSSSAASPPTPPIETEKIPTIRPTYETLPIAQVTPSPWFSKFDAGSDEPGAPSDTLTYSDETPSLGATSRPTYPTVPSPSNSMLASNSPGYDSSSLGDENGTLSTGSSPMPTDNYPAVSSPSNPSFASHSVEDSSSLGDENDVLSTGALSTPAGYYPASPSSSIPTFASSSDSPTIGASSVPTVYTTALSPFNSTSLTPTCYYPSIQSQSLTPTLENNQTKDDHLPSSSLSLTPTHISLAPTIATESTGSNVSSTLPPFLSIGTDENYLGESEADTSQSVSGSTSPASETIPPAVPEMIKAKCSGDVNMEKIINGDKWDCLDVCKEGMCCYIDEFIAAGITAKDEDTGAAVVVDSCMKGNELTCYEYSSCLVMTLEREPKVTLSPSPTMSVPPPAPIVPFANLGEIFDYCSGPKNMALITNHDVEANMNCLNACSKGFCCYIELFTKRGISAVDEEGNAVTIDSCWKGNEAICAGYESCLVLTLAAPNPHKPPQPSPPLLAPSLPASDSAVAPKPTPQPTILSTPEPTPFPTLQPTLRPTELLNTLPPVISSATEPFTIIPAAPLDAITDACTGAEKTQLISSGDEQAKGECIKSCSQGACCYADVFNAVGIFVIDDEGNKSTIETCFAGNEVICGGYSGCLTLSLSYSRPKTASPTTATPAPSITVKYVPEAQLKVISKACTENTNLITSGDEQAKRDCFNACQPGLCCYSSVFNALGMQSVTQQGDTVLLESCLEGNEVICGGYSGCLALSLSD